MKAWRKEQGSAVVEATIALTAFIFAMMALISLIQLVMVQTMMQNALNQTAKEISQDTYLYEAFGLLDVKSDTAASNDAVVDSIEQTQSDLSSLLSAFTDETEDPSEVVDDLQTQFSTIKDNLASSAVYAGFNALDKKVCQSIFQKYVSSDGNKKTADANLKRYNIMNGASGLDFSASTVLKDKEKIVLVVKYSVKVISPLGGYREVKCRQVATTRGWVGDNGKESSEG